MKFRELFDLVRAGKAVDVEILKAIEEGHEGYLEAGMRGRIVRVELEGDEVAVAHVDVAPFEAHNRTFESANYFDKSGNPRLTAREAGHYPADGICSVYLDAGDGPLRPFLPLNNGQCALYSEYAASRPSITYLAWLEGEVTRLRAAGAGG